MAGIPDEFNEDFLDWFRERTEAAWAALPAHSPEDVLAEQVKGGAGGSQWQQGTRWLSGLRDAEVEEVERRWSLTFPPDYRFFLRRLHTVDRPRLRASYLAEGEQSQDASGVRAATFIERYRQYMVLQDGPSFYNWLTDTEALQGQFAWL